MRPVDLDNLDKKPLFVALQFLEDCGYKRIPVETSGSLWYFAHPDKPEEMLRLSFMVTAADAHVKLCAENPGNPYLPFIHEHRRIGDNPALCITAMERLYSSAELPAEKILPLTGMGRAAALLPVGEPQHADAHRHMLRNDMMRAAVQAFARAVAHSARQDDETALRYDDGMNPAIGQNDQISSNMLYRQSGNAWRPVFAEPLSICRVRDDAHRDALRRDADAMVARLTL